MSASNLYKPHNSPLVGNLKIKKSLTTLKMSASASSLLSPRGDMPMSPFDPLRTAISKSSLNSPGLVVNSARSSHSDIEEIVVTQASNPEEMNTSRSQSGNFSEYGSESSYDTLKKYAVEKTLTSPRNARLSIGNNKKIIPLSNGCKVKVTSPGGENGLGPWCEDNVSSPIIHRKFSVSDTMSHKLHIVTIGKHNNEDQRRIKIYEHKIDSNDWEPSLIQKNLSEDPRHAFLLLDGLLRNPKHENKLVDKVLPKAMAIKALAGAQTTLQSLYGGWLHPLEVIEEEGLHAASPYIWVVSHSPQSGTIARRLKDLPKNATREDVNIHIRTYLGKIIDKLFQKEAALGVSFALIAPLGKTAMNYFC